MLRIAVTALASLIALTGVASAGCANYVDGSLKTPAPKVELCVKGHCDQPVIVSECGNVRSVQVNFSNGWGFWSDVETKTSGGANNMNGARAELADATCRSLDKSYGDACPLIDQPKP